MKKKVKLGLIGYGQRGVVLSEGALKFMDDVEICGVCDAYKDRAEAGADFYKELRGKRPLATTDYRDILKLDIDGVIISAAWEAHVEIALAAMNAGKYVGVEVGGAYSVEDCWELVRTSEKTGMPCMMLENCCYGKRELMILNMVKKGVFGDVVFCEGGYCHDLRDEILGGEENRHYRLRNYIHRNCENYPTHEIGPIAKILNINNGNRMLTLSAMASPAKGLQQRAAEKRGADSALANTHFNQGDVVQTMIHCANGELITITLSTTTPHVYSRKFTVQGTRALYLEDNDSLIVDGKEEIDEEDPNTKQYWGNAEKYEAEYTHPLWREYDPVGGHNGLDFMVLSGFVEAIKKGTQTPIDVYDTASWMVISTLSEQSIAMGGAVQAIPDFTRGHWMQRNDIPDLKYGLDKVSDE